jgi:hypothetical protein
VSKYILTSYILLIKDRLGITEDCKNFKKLPNIQITFKTRKEYKSNEYITSRLTLKPEDYIIDGQKIKDGIVSFDEDVIVDPSLSCKPAFMSIDVPRPRGPILVFGEYFLKKFYTVFDRDENVIGLSVANHHSFTYEYH